MNIIAAKIICLVIGYLCGLIQTGYIYGKLHGVDIRQHGSGNAGTTNTLRTLGAKAGAITLLGDMLKTIIAIVIAWLLFRNTFPDLMPLLKVYAGAGAVLGHDYPFYLKFKGGKGIASMAGLIVGLGNPIMIVCEGLIFFSIFFATHYVSLGSLMFSLGFAVECVIIGQLGLGDMGAMPQSARIELYVIVFILAALAWYQHRANIGRLLSHSERKTYITKKGTA